MSIIDNLKFFPKAESEISWKINNFHSLDRVIQQILPHVVLTTMECLEKQYDALKQRAKSNSAVTESINQRKREITDKATNLVAYSGKMSVISSNIRSKIATIEARLV